MSPDPNRVEAVFAAALEKASPEERAVYLDQACAGASPLRSRPRPSPYPGPGSIMSATTRCWGNWPGAAWGWCIAPAR
jgi:hypothetical protein